MQSRLHGVSEASVSLALAVRAYAASGMTIPIIPQIKGGVEGVVTESFKVGDGFDGLHGVLLC